MNHLQIQSIATQNNLGKVSFEWKVMLDTGELMEVGYIYVDGRKIIFCKNASADSNSFYICNQYKELNY